MQLDEVIELSSRVEGWLSREEQSLLFELARSVPAGGTIVEIGSWMGRSTIVLGAGSLSCPGAKVYAIDLFNAGVGETSCQYLPYRKGFDTDYLATFEENIRCAGVDTIIEPIRAASVEAAHRWDGPSIDLLFLDADHSFEGVRNDFLAWVSHCKPNARCVFHDYFNGKHPGVRRFVDNLLRARLLKDIQVADTILSGRLPTTDRDRVQSGLKHTMRPWPFSPCSSATYKRHLSEFYTRSGWIDFSQGNRLGAILNGGRSIRLKPWRAEAWRLAIVAALKPTKRN